MDTETTVRLLEETDVLQVIWDTDLAVRPGLLTQSIPTHLGLAGDSLLLYTEHGFFWIQYIVPKEAGIATHYTILDGMGSPITTSSTLDYIRELYPELNDFSIIVLESDVPISDEVIRRIDEDIEEIVEVRGSSSCFEYQFPASPAFFVGRIEAIQEIMSFSDDVLSRTTSARGIAFEANSGWGKSSLVLASIEQLRKMGHGALAIDCRSASSSQFVLRAVEYALSSDATNSSLAPLSGLPAITGFDGAIQRLLELGDDYMQRGRLFFIFFDQFENVFYLQDLLRRLRDVVMKVCDSQTGLIIGFSWKTDLIGSTGDFPYELRDEIRNSSFRVGLQPFSRVETDELLDRLREELGAPLRKGLMFFLSEFSQGYPWLLKKLCAHVMAQHERGLLQSDMANNLLNVSELFEEDVRGLSAEQMEALQRLARVAPIGVLELGEEFSAQVVQSLVNERLIIRVGSKYDLYWDIFRDYLNLGRVPVQDNYILRSQVGTVLRAAKILSDVGQPLQMGEFRERSGFTEKSIYNVARDLRVLGIATVTDNRIALTPSLKIVDKEFEENLRVPLTERLQRNRLVQHLLREVETRGSLTVPDIAVVLADACPYISATEKTWKTYGRIFAGWFEFADLGNYNSGNGVLSRSVSGTEVRERRSFLSKQTGYLQIPSVQYVPVEEAGIRIGEALQAGRRINWIGFSKTTQIKSLATLDDLGFIERKTGVIHILRRMRIFVNEPDRRKEILRDAVLTSSAFVKFIEILEQHKDSHVTDAQLAVEWAASLKIDWKPETAKTNAKILLNWARHLDLAPGHFGKAMRSDRSVRRVRVDSQAGPRQLSLF